MHIKEFAEGWLDAIPDDVLEQAFYVMDAADELHDDNPDGVWAGLVGEAGRTYVLDECRERVDSFEMFSAWLEWRGMGRKLEG